MSDFKSIRQSLSQLEVAAYQAHAQRDTYRQLLDEAFEIIRRGLIAAPDAYIACSFGKDSAVMLHLILSCAQQQARFIRWEGESEFLDNYEVVIEAWRSLHTLDLHILDLRRSSLDEKVAGRWQQMEALSPAAGYFIGLRAEESRARRMTIRQHGTVYQKVDGIWRICPLANWRTIDIGAYVIEHDLPMLSTYHAEGFEGRTASRVPRANVRGLALTALRTRDPNGFEALAVRFPEVREWV